MDWLQKHGLRLRLKSFAAAGFLSSSEAFREGFHDCASFCNNRVRKSNPGFNYIYIYVYPGIHQSDSPGLTKEKTYTPEYIYTEYIYIYKRSYLPCLALFTLYFSYPRLVSERSSKHSSVVVVVDVVSPHAAGPESRT